MTAHHGLGPAIPRRRLGAELRRLRHGKGKRLSEVADDLLISTSKLSRLEKGQGPARDRDMRDLLDYYGEADTELGERMWTWAREGRETPWWQETTEVLPPAVDQYIRYETAAAEIRGYVVHFVPTLLQTADYARAVYEIMEPGEPEEIERLVELTKRRQDVLTQDDYPVTLDVVIDESVLHRVVGTREVMRAQLDALARASEMPNVRLRVYRFETGPHRAMAEGVFTLFHFRKAIDQDVVNIEGRLNDVYVEQPEIVSVYRDLLDGLRQQALDPGASIALIRDIARKYNPSR